MLVAQNAYGGAIEEEFSILKIIGRESKMRLYQASAHESRRHMIVVHTFWEKGIYRKGV